MVSTRRSKRRRLMVSSYVSPRRPDLPAIFESLNDDTLTTILQFVGNKSYRTFGGLNKHCREIYLTTEGMTKETFLFGYAPLSVIKEIHERRGRFNQEGHDRVGKGVVFYNRSDVLDWVLEERNIYLLRGICAIAAMEGRIDILNEVYNNMNDEDNKEMSFYYVDEYAALYDKYSSALELVLFTLMEPSRSEPRRLISISSYVSPRQRPDLPARFESLNDDTLTTILQFVGDKSYNAYAGINKQCKEVYIKSDMAKKTFVYGFGSLTAIKERYANNAPLNDGIFRPLMVGEGVVFYNRLDVLDWAVQERKTNILKAIRAVAAEYERFDIMDKVWNGMNDEDVKRDIFERIDLFAARHGKLNVLKWVETKGLHSNEWKCGHVAAHCGHVHIIQWLQEEKSFEFLGLLYVGAIEGGQLHVLKWLRDHEVPFYDHNFLNAARSGNLDILQWLHDEGCPWPDDEYRVGEGDLKAEVIDWCRANGYGNRIVSEED